MVGVLQNLRIQKLAMAILDGDPNRVALSVSAEGRNDALLLDEQAPSKTVG